MTGVQFLVTTPKVRTNFGDLGIGRRIILNFVLKKLDVIVCVEFILLSRGSRVRLLCIQ
jgi:hypothetical protein